MRLVKERDKGLHQFNTKTDAATLTSKQRIRKLDLLCHLLGKSSYFQMKESETIRR